MIRVGLNGLFLEKPMTGTGRYTQHLLEQLSQAWAGCECEAFGLRGSLSQWPRLQVLADRLPLSRLSPNLTKLYFEQIAFPLACRRISASVAHYPYFASSLKSFLPTVATVHDLVPMLFPQYQTGPSVRLYTHLVALACRRATVLITDSLASQEDIVRVLRVPRDRIRVVHLAADERFRPGASTDLIASLRRRYRLPDEFLLYLGGIDYRKNVSRLLEALAALGRRGPSLVIGGTIPGPSSLFTDIHRSIAELGLGDRVCLCGPLEDSDIPLLYQAAVAFVYPSLYEGFGLPPLEAMACGTPVVCSNASSLPEVVGDAALTFDPTDVEGLAEAINAVLADPDRRAEMRRRGLLRAARFSWTAVARQTLDAYGAAIDGK